MNLWRCGATHCDKSCVGIGGAVGLRAIGWYFKTPQMEGLIAPLLRCPSHHPHPSVQTCDEHNCAVCKNVEHIQALVSAHPEP